MTEHDPVDLHTTPDVLPSLAADRTGYAVEAPAGLWLFRDAGSPLLVTAISVDLAFKFEVFTLAVWTVEQARNAAESARPPPLLSGEPVPAWSPGRCLASGTGGCTRERVSVPLAPAVASRLLTRQSSDHCRCFLTYLVR